MIVVSILATDMTCHFGLTDELKNVAVRSGDAINALLNATRCPLRDAEDVLVELAKPDRDVLLKTLLHAADISNPCKPFQVSKNWSDRVTEVGVAVPSLRSLLWFRESRVPTPSPCPRWGLCAQEFFAQGDLEKAEQLPVSPNMDRITTKQSQLSINFIGTTCDAHVCGSSLVFLLTRSLLLSPSLSVVLVDLQTLSLHPCSHRWPPFCPRRRSSVTCSVRASVACTTQHVPLMGRHVSFLSMPLYQRPIEPPGCPCNKRRPRPPATLEACSAERQR